MGYLPAVPELSLRRVKATGKQVAEEATAEREMKGGNGTTTGPTRPATLGC